MFYSEIHTIIYVDAGNDRNGNPRRGWAVETEKGVHTFVDHEYVGVSALKSWLKENVDEWYINGEHVVDYLLKRVTGCINITPKQYREFKKFEGK